MAGRARILDLTRLVSRLGKGALTGIDRVEAAYLAHLGAGGALFGLVRTQLGVLILGDDGLRNVADWVNGAALPPSSPLARLIRPKDKARAAAEGALRAEAIARAPLFALKRRLAALFPDGFDYLNVGHSNLDPAMLGVLAGGRRIVMVHDTIPLDYPQFTRPDRVAPFARKLASVSAHADLVIHTAQVTRQQTEAHLTRLGRCPDGLVAPLGITPAIPLGTTPPAPYFVALGTIEPRKNTGFLLDLWAALAERLGSRCPRLYLIGNRGWDSPAILARLDAKPAYVTEVSGLSDGAVAAYLQNATALLWPSMAEGYGLPPAEAASHGTPVLAHPLAITCEVMGDYPIYLDTADVYSWMETIIRLMDKPKAEHTVLERWAAPDWAAHFRIVLSNL